ncbi:acetyl-CoA acetyltransferase [Mycolicibacterium sp.]|uniref:acetyl-CoA acetyltransferase n=1 Tax=Mycolicibacterium sp. TaxID=2320850 RepID=UPI003D0FF3D3
MKPQGIRDRVAIVGMGCTPFGERWDVGPDEMLIDATTQACTSAGVDIKEVEAFWLGTALSGYSGLALSKPLQLDYRPVTRVENFCATGSDAFRNACYAVASGVVDVAMAVGVEKNKDSGVSGVAVPERPNDGTLPWLTGPALYSFLVPSYCQKYGVSREDVKEAITHIAWKNHRNGAHNARAHFRREVSKEAIRRAPKIAGELGLYDCSGVSDGAAAAIVVRAEDAHRYTPNPLYVKALSLVAGPGAGLSDTAYDYTTFHEVSRAAEVAYQQAGVTDPGEEIALAEVHDCFTITELILMEDLGLSERGKAWRDVLDGRFDFDGDLPVNASGGLKSFGHPTGATGLRMLFECWGQLRGDVPPERQITTTKRLGLTHNLGGGPGECVSFVGIVGCEPS